MAAIPLLGSSCAVAATAAESRYRIDVPIAPSRGARVVALDAGAAEATSRVAAGQWAGARFLTCDPAAAGLALLGVGGAPVDLADQLDRADVVVMIASADSAAACASALGRACWERGIMTAGVVLGDGLQAQQAVAALRPHARVLLPAADESDVTELLSALRA